MQGSHGAKIIATSQQPMPAQLLDPWGHVHAYQAHSCVVSNRNYIIRGTTTAGEGTAQSAIEASQGKAPLQVPTEEASEAATRDELLFGRHSSDRSSEFLSTF